MATARGICEQSENRNHAWRYVVYTPFGIRAASLCLNFGYSMARNPTAPLSLSPVRSKSDFPIRIRKLKNSMTETSMGFGGSSFAILWRPQGRGMQQRAIAEIKRRQPAIPWDVPIRVHFACDDRPLYGCRYCILRYGLKSGDRTRLFFSEAEALAHTGSHVETAASRDRLEREAAERRYESRGGLSRLCSVSRAGSFQTGLRPSEQFREGLPTQGANQRRHA